MPTPEEAHGAELGKLSQLLFDKAVRFFYSAISIEVLAGIGAVVFEIFNFSDGKKVAAAIAGFLLLVVAYYCKVQFEAIYDAAETMRRQSVLSNGLGWSISRVQFSEWRSLAGKSILDEVDSHPLDPNYFATQESSSPKRLLEMTQESAFWTRHLYTELNKWIWPIFIFSLFFFFLVLTFSASGYADQGIALKLVHAVYLILPLILTLDILGWAFHLNRIINALKKIEEGLEQLEGNQNLGPENVLRLVAEYNCQLVKGFPIPDWFFRRHHDYIANLWDKAKGT